MNMTTTSLPTTDHGTFIIRPMHVDDVASAGQIMCEAFNTQNQRLGLPPEWPNAAFTTGLVQSLVAHPGFVKIAAVDKHTNAVIGINFLEMGDTVTAPGPISVDTQGQNKGVGRALMDYVIQHSLAIGKQDIRLVQVSNNSKSFALYASQGFRFGETLTMLAGRVTDEEQLTRYRAAYEVRPMTEDDVEHCCSMHEQANQFPRCMDIRGAVHPASPHQPFVALQNGQIVAYTTGFSLLGHAVAVDTDAFKALFSLVSNVVDGALFHLPARVYPELLAWAVSEAGLTVVRQEILMYRGRYRALQATPVYPPGMAY